MAHIEYRRHGGRGQLVINGVDFSHEVFRGAELVEVGEDEGTAEVGFRVTFAVGRLDLDTESEIVVTDHFYEVAQQVSSMSEGEAIA